MARTAIRDRLHYTDYGRCGDRIHPKSGLLITLSLRHQDLSSCELYDPTSRCGLFNDIFRNAGRLLALLARGANAGERDFGGATPLHYASLHGHADVAMGLLQAGAPPHAIDRYTFLHPFKAALQPVVAPSSILGTDL